MRGSLLFNDLFTNELTATRARKATKGRSMELDTKRNELLLLRYIYYGKYTTNRYEVVLQKLEDEFYLSQRTIIDIIQKNATLLRQYRAEFPAPLDLKKRYPHLVW